MADKEKLPQEQGKKSVDVAQKSTKEVKEKVPFTAKVKKFIKDYKSEMKKITWPTKNQVIKNTGIVIAAIVLVAAIVGVLDLGFSQGIRLLGNAF